MSSDDVIELGSSDEETRPPPKKKQTIPNAMVRFPNLNTKLPGVNLGNLKVQIASRAVTLNKVKSNLQKTPKTNQRTGPKVPLLMSCRKSVIVKKVPSNPSNLPVLNKSSGSKLLKNLPPSITIKRTSNSLHNNVIPPLKKIRIEKRPVKTGPIVEIDIEPSETTQTLPLWYKRPEEQDLDSSTKLEPCKLQPHTIKQQNNTEPSKFIEIVIEDSPVKPQPSFQDKFITIDDSPVKASESASNKEVDKKSKKMLAYPNVKVAQDGMIEIEIDSIDPIVPCQDEKNAVAKTGKPSSQNQKKEDTVAVIEKDAVTPQDNKKSEDITNDMVHQSKEEFNAIYQKFIETCFRIENSSDMQKIVANKIKPYYKQCPPEYVNSEEFQDLVSAKTMAIENTPTHMYYYIRNVVDELKTQKKMAKAALVKNNENKDNVDELLDTSGYDEKRQRQIRKLDKTLKKLHRAIQKLEEKEVDFDDEDDSVYLLTERYKDRILRVHAKFCQLTNTKMPSEPFIKLDCQAGRSPGPVKKLEKWINKKVPLGQPRPFPDFHDVLRCVKEANEEDNLGLSEMEMLDEARQLFTMCGKKLQRRRQDNDWRIAASRLSVNVDPAESDQDLRRKLEENKLIASQKEADIFKKYVDRQNQLNVESRELDDKETEESPDNSEEDEDEKVNIIKCTKEKKVTFNKLNQEKLEQNSNREEGKNNEDRDIIRKESKPVQQNEAQKNLENGMDCESDADPMHLLERVYSDSDSVSLISLSDSDNNIETQKDTAIDVISIEDSSYSESEIEQRETVESGEIEVKAFSYVSDAVVVGNHVSPTIPLTKEIQKILDSEKYSSTTINDKAIEATVQAVVNNKCNDDMLSMKSSDIVGEMSNDNLTDKIGNENDKNTNNISNKNVLSIVEVDEKSDGLNDNLFKNNKCAASNNPNESIEVPTRTEGIQPRENIEETNEQRFLVSDDESRGCVNIADDNISITDTFYDPKLLNPSDNDRSIEASSLIVTSSDQGVNTDSNIDTLKDNNDRQVTDQKLSDEINDSPIQIISIRSNGNEFLNVDLSKNVESENTNIENVPTNSDTPVTSHTS
ncbi:unnamed protein product [Leptosia nina]|uniref:Daxx histone-binding domain-containing protein n=1 Tax=Leptosia nina TaxID=320188 RepID=A0AAV1JHH2_9NEOP